MTIQELIDQLNEIEDKTQIVNFVFSPSYMQKKYADYFFENNDALLYGS